MCIYVSTNHATYSLGDGTLYIAYGAFSYGSIGYDFNTHKMDKGTSKEQVTFDEFRAYGMSVIK